MILDSLHVDVAQGSSGQYSSCKLQYFCQVFLIAEFVNRGPPHHAFDGYGTLQRRHLDDVTGLKTLQIGPDTVQQKVIEVYFLNDVLAANMHHLAQRPT